MNMKRTTQFRILKQNQKNSRIENTPYRIYRVKKNGELYETPNEFHLPNSLEDARIKAAYLAKINHGTTFAIVDAKTNQEIERIA